VWKYPLVEMSRYSTITFKLCMRLPTLVLNAKNDPFLPQRYLPRPQEVSPQVRLEQPEEGGHVGFADGAFPGTLDWLPRRLIAFFREHPL
jgi:uncharacterized protein